VIAPVDCKFFASFNMKPVSSFQVNAPGIFIAFRKEEKKPAGCVSRAGEGVNVK